MTAGSFYNAHQARQNQLEKEFAPKIFRELKAQANGFLNSIEENGYSYSRSRIDSIVSFSSIAVILKSFYGKAAYMESNYVLRYVKNNLKQKRMGGKFGFGITFDELAPVIDQYFQIYLLNKSAIPISETTKRMIVNHLIKQVDAGAPLNEAIKNFRQLAISGTERSASFSESRARNIALTESTRSMSFGSLIGAYQSGVDCEKVWITSHDEKVRHKPYSHARLDRQVTSLLEPFQNGEAIKFPGDPEAHIANTANCRCCMFYRKKPNGRPAGVRLLTDFLSDFFAGFMIGTFINQQLETEVQ